MTVVEALPMDIQEALYHYCKDNESLNDAFIRALRTELFRWHDLRKNPDDLPKGKINRYLFGYVKNYSGKKPMIIAYNGEWFYDVNTYNTEVKVIVWCEIPEFNEK